MDGLTRTSVAVLVHTSTVGAHDVPVLRPDTALFRVRHAHCKWPRL